MKLIIRIMKIIMKMMINIIMRMKMRIKMGDNIMRKVRKRKYKLIKYNNKYFNNNINTY